MNLNIWIKKVRIKEWLRIIETYDAMFYGRNYQDAVTQSQIIQEIESLSDVYYDKELVDTYF
jgi:response regulator RpfG family c-di-GMP phosphodiesterase